jgi:RNA polymerase sigma factor (sigma-70 family)
MNNYCHSCGHINGFVYPEVKNLRHLLEKSQPDQSLFLCAKCSGSLLIERLIERQESVSSPHFNSTGPIDLEQLIAILLADINDVVRWAYLRYRGRICLDELDDLSQQIILTLIKNHCRRLRSFSGQSSFKTWLQAVVDHHIYNYSNRRKQTEPLDEIDQELLTYSPLQDQGIDTAEKRKLLLNALSKLSGQERLLFQLWFISELDIKEIAAIFRTEVKIIYKRKQTLVLKLRRLVQGFQSY